MVGLITLFGSTALGIGPEGPAGPIGEQGPAGPAAPSGLTWRGSWEIATAYDVGDSVASGGNVYFCILASTGDDPSVSPTKWQLLSMQGLQGEQGVQGDPGIQGVQGPVGPQGNQGIQGAQGAQGIQGAPGDTGAQGIQGVQGVQGDPGDASIFAFQGVFSNGGTYAAYDVVTFGGASYWCYQASGATIDDPATNTGSWALLAAKGEQGDQGPTGADGADGADGAAGPQGIQGDPGPMGPSVLIWLGTWNSLTTYQQNDWVSPPSGGNSYFALRTNTNKSPATNPQDWALLLINGPAGAQGPQGAQGPAGAVGARGPTGAQGIQGPRGIQGVAGAQGPRGNTGSQGPAGPRGLQGVQGVQGVAGQTGAQGTAGPAGPSGGGALAATLSANINSSVTSITIVANGEWPLIPTDLAQFYVLIGNELMLVTATSGPNSARVLTVVRGQRGTTAANHNRNNNVYLRQTFGNSGGIAQTIVTGDITADITHANGHFYHANASDVTVTIPPNSSVAYPIGTTLTFVNNTTHSLAITSSDTVVYAADGTTTLRTIASYGMATAVKVAATTWMISGTGLA